MSLGYTSPIISPFSAHALTLFFASCYVGSLYISKNARLSFARRPKSSQNGTRQKQSHERWRDDPEVIRARLLAASVATLICCGGVFTLLRHVLSDGNDTLGTAFVATITRLGLGVDDDSLRILPYLITPLLFLGPLYARYLGGCLPFQMNWIYQYDVVEKIFSWVGVRNYIIAPITEEVVFRSCVLSVYQLSGFSRKQMIFLAPLSFGLAHLHHAWDTFNRYGRTASAAKHAIVSSTFQFIYTTIFGFHCSYLFIRTGSIYPPIVAHCFCNIMGFPEPSWEIRAYPRYKQAILLAYLLGLVSFVVALEPFTRTSRSLYWRDLDSDLKI